MRRKIIGILVCVLLSVTFVSVTGTGNVEENKMPSCDEPAPEMTYKLPHHIEAGFKGKTFYAMEIFPGYDLIKFDSEDPGGYEVIAPASSPEFLSGGTWDDCGVWWACEYDGPGTKSNIWTIDETDGTMTLVGTADVGLTGIAYDISTGTMYGCFIDKLYTIDMETAEATLVGPLSDHFFIGIAIDGEHNAYGIDLDDDSLYAIDLDTAETTLIGWTGLPTLNYAQDMAYDIDDGILYLAAFVGWGGLYICNTNTGATTLIGYFPVHVDAFAIPYASNEPPLTPNSPSGPTKGVTGVEYTFTAITTDPEGEQIWYLFDWNDGEDSGWVGPYNSGQTGNASHTWTEKGTYEIKVKAKDVCGAESEWSDVYPVTIVENEPPNAPTIEGETSGKPGTSYDYTFTSTDPDGNQVSYYIKWGDGDTTDWTAFQPSGSSYSENHTWEKGTWIIKARAKDEFGLIGPEATLTVTMPRSRATSNVLFYRFLEQFPILRHLLRL